MLFRSAAISSKIRIPGKDPPGKMEVLVEKVYTLSLEIGLEKTHLKKVE